MVEYLISFETARLAKEKGFNLECRKYNRIGNLYLPHAYIDKKDLSFTFPAPTQSLLQKWLRDIHNIHISIDLSSDEELKTLIPFSYEAMIYYNSEIVVVRHFFDTYEEALEEALKQSLKLIK